MSSVNSALPLTWLLRMLLAIMFCAFATACSVVDTARPLVEQMANVSLTNKSLDLQHLNILGRRQRTNSRSNILYGSTCSDDQVTYINTAMNEAKDLTTRAYDAVSEILEIMQQKEEPSDWPAASYTRRYRNFRLWDSLFGKIPLGKVNGKNSRVQTLSQMKAVRSIYGLLKVALDAKEDKLKLTINCADNWLLYLHDDDNGNRIYQDNRYRDRTVTIAILGTCNENPAGRAYTFEHDFTKEEETVYCPNSFALWGGKLLGDIQSSSFASLRGRDFKYVKEYAVTGTVVHEATHVKGTLDTLQADDLEIPYRGRVYRAYGSVLCRELARIYDKETGLPEQNADTLAFFALGVYFSQCNWANENRPGRCSDDLPDTICPTNDDGERKCVKFFT